MSSFNRKSSDRRLVDMSPPPQVEPTRAWIPYLPPDESMSTEQTIVLSEGAKCIQRLGIDELGRLVEWAVVQTRLVDEKWRRVAVYDYDNSHNKGVHLHLFDYAGEEVTQIRLRDVTSYKDVEDGLEYVLHHLIDLEDWRENDRRSRRGAY